MSIVRALLDDLMDAIDEVLCSKWALYITIAAASWFLGLACGIAVEGWIW